MADKKGREAELMELQKAEESHREMFLKDRDERNKIAKDLHSLRRCNLILQAIRTAARTLCTVRVAGVTLFMCG